MLGFSWPISRQLPVDTRHGLGVKGGLRSVRQDPLAPNGPLVATIEPVIRVEFERIEALELLGMMLAHLNNAETRAETSPRVPLLMAIRDKLARGLTEEL